MVYQDQHVRHKSSPPPPTTTTTTTTTPAPAPPPPPPATTTGTTGYIAPSEWDKVTSYEKDYEEEENLQCCRRDYEKEFRKKRKLETLSLPSPQTWTPSLLFLDAKLPMAFITFLVQWLAHYRFMLFDTTTSSSSSSSSSSSMDRRIFQEEIQRHLDQQHNLIFLLPHSYHPYQTVVMDNYLMRLKEVLLPRPRCVYLSADEVFTTGMAKKSWGGQAIYRSLMEWWTESAAGGGGGGGGGGGSSGGNPPPPPPPPATTTPVVGNGDKKVAVTSPPPATATATTTSGSACQDLLSIMNSYRKIQAAGNREGGAGGGGGSGSGRVNYTHQRMEEINRPLLERYHGATGGGGGDGSSSSESFYHYDLLVDFLSNVRVMSKRVKQSHGYLNTLNPPPPPAAATTTTHGSPRRNNNSFTSSSQSRDSHRSSGVSSGGGGGGSGGAGGGGGEGSSYRQDLALSVYLSVLFGIDGLALGISYPDKEVSRAFLAFRHYLSTSGVQDFATQLEGLTSRFTSSMEEGIEKTCAAVLSKLRAVSNNATLQRWASEVAAGGGGGGGGGGQRLEGNKSALPGGKPLGSLPGRGLPNRATVVGGVAAVAVGGGGGAEGSRSRENSVTNKNSNAGTSKGSSTSSGSSSGVAAGGGGGGGGGSEAEANHHLLLLRNLLLHYRDSARCPARAWLVQWIISAEDYLQRSVPHAHRPSPFDAVLCPLPDEIYLCLSSPPPPPPPTTPSSSTQQSSSSSSDQQEKSFAETSFDRTRMVYQCPSSSSTTSSSSSSANYGLVFLGELLHLFWQPLEVFTTTKPLWRLCYEQGGRLGCRLYHPQLPLPLPRLQEEEEEVGGRGKRELVSQVHVYHHGEEILVQLHIRARKTLSQPLLPSPPPPAPATSHDTVGMNMLPYDQRPQRKRRESLRQFCRRRSMASITQLDLEQEEEEMEQEEEENSGDELLFEQFARHGTQGSDSGSKEEEEEVVDLRLFGRLSFQDLLLLLQPNYTEIFEGRGENPMATTATSLTRRGSKKKKSSTQVAGGGGGGGRYACYHVNDFYHLLSQWVVVDHLQAHYLHLSLCRARLLLLTKVTTVCGYPVQLEIYEERFGELSIAIFGLPHLQVMNREGEMKVVEEEEGVGGGGLEWSSDEEEEEEEEDSVTVGGGGEKKVVYIYSVHRYHVYQLLSTLSSSSSSYDLQQQKDKLEAFDTLAMAYIFTDRLVFSPSRRWRECLAYHSFLPASSNHHYHYHSHMHTPALNNNSANQGSGGGSGSGSGSSDVMTSESSVVMVGGGGGGGSNSGSGNSGSGSSGHYAFHRGIVMKIRYRGGPGRLVGRFLINLTPSSTSSLRRGTSREEEEEVVEQEEEEEGSLHLVVTVFEINSPQDLPELRLVLYCPELGESVDYRLSSLETRLLFQPPPPPPPTATTSGTAAVKRSKKRFTMLAQLKEKLQVVYTDLHPLRDQQRVLLEMRPWNTKKKKQEEEEEEQQEEEEEGRKKKRSSLPFSFQPQSYEMEGDDEYEICSQISEQEEEDWEEEEEDGLTQSDYGNKDFHDDEEEGSATHLNHHEEEEEEEEFALPSRYGSGSRGSGSRGSGSGGSGRRKKSKKRLHYHRRESGWGWAITFDRSLLYELRGNLTISTTLSLPRKGFCVWVYDPRTAYQTYTYLSYADCQAVLGKNLVMLEEELSNLDESVVVDLLDEVLQAVEVEESDEEGLVVVLLREKDIPPSHPVEEEKEKEKEATATQGKVEQEQEEEEEEKVKLSEIAKAAREENEWKTPIKSFVLEIYQKLAPLEREMLSAW
eukprot:scaffold39_cov176-Ochromonas_danica.AAC.6